MYIALHSTTLWLPSSQSRCKAPSFNIPPSCIKGLCASALEQVVSIDKIVAIDSSYSLKTSINNTQSYLL